MAAVGKEDFHVQQQSDSERSNRNTRGRHHRAPGHPVADYYPLSAGRRQLREGAGSLRNEDARAKLEAIAKKLSFSWIRTAVKKVDELAELLRRNIQKTIALDDLILELRAA